MIYSFSDEVFNSNDETIDILDRIWVNSLGRHQLYISDVRLYDQIKSTNWYQGLRKSSKEHIESNFTASIYINKRDIGVQISEDNYSLIEAEEILTQDFIIILENIEYDKYFFTSIIKHFKEGNKIKDHYERGWLKFANGGGNNISNVLNELSNRYSNNKNFPKKVSNYIRAFVIIDSDKKYPSIDEVAEDKIKLLDIIKNIVGTSYHVTNKREMENYLPDEVFKDIQTNKDYINAYLTLTPIQKDFFDIENGLPDKNIESLEPEEYRKLYQDLKNPVLDILRKKSFTMTGADGKKIKFKANFPKYFESTKVDRLSLTKRANSKELEEMLLKINKLL